jgi:hypothetical protein
MIDPATAVFFRPPNLSKFKHDLFDRIGRAITARGGAYVVGDFALLDHKVRKGRIPIVGCTPELRPYIDRWKADGRTWCYWDRGYWLRVFATDLPTGRDGGMYRFHVNSYQLQQIRDAPDDRLKRYPVTLAPWSKPGRHIVVAEPSETYQRFHGIEGWTERTLDALDQITDRPVIVRDKEMQRRGTDGMPGGRRLRDDLRGAHCLVTHGSNAAVEAVIMGCPVFVHADSAAALVGRTELNEIERPIYPDREPWARSLAYSQWSEREMIDGTLWRHLS